MNKVKELINKNSENFIIKSNQSESVISEAEQKLGFKFDSIYEEYLKELGSISFESMECLGLGRSDSSYLNVVNITKEIINAEKSFPNNAVVLEDIGEGNCVIYIMNKGVFQYSVSSLDLITKTIEEYLLMRFKEMS